MKTFEGVVSKNNLVKFISGRGCEEYFSYVGNFVTLEQCLGVISILSPDFVEQEGHIFWTPDASKYNPDDRPLIGLSLTDEGKLERSTKRKDIERYRNVFAISQFFSKWEDSPIQPVSAVEFSNEELELCQVFAAQIEKYWKIALSEKFQDVQFEFEIGNDILDEYGVCLTFWQV